MSACKTSAMKTIFTTAFIFVSSFLFAQKKYDCIIYCKLPSLNDSLPKEERFVGYLRFITDSNIVIRYYGEEVSYSWKDVSRVKFRLHNGFGRIALPIAGGIGILGASIVIAANAGVSQAYAIVFSPLVAIYFSVSSLYFVTPAYFIFRNKTFGINSYEDFIKLKQVSPKYITK